MGTKDNFNCITVTPVQGKNPRTLYEHQIDAMKALDGINQNLNSAHCLYFLQEAVKHLRRLIGC